MAIRTLAAIGETRTIEILLLQHGYDVNEAERNFHTPLWAALSAGHADTAELLLKYGAALPLEDSNIRALFAHARFSPDIYQLLIDYGLKPAPLDVCGVLGSVYGYPNSYCRILSILLQQDGIDPDGKIDDLPLLIYVILRCVLPDTIETIIENGANIDIRVDSGSTPLMYACRHCYCRRRLVAPDPHKTNCEAILKYITRPEQLLFKSSYPADEEVDFTALDYAVKYRKRTSCIRIVRSILQAYISFKLEIPKHIEEQLQDEEELTPFWLVRKASLQVRCFHEVIMTGQDLSLLPPIVVYINTLLWKKLKHLLPS